MTSVRVFSAILSWRLTEELLEMQLIIKAMQKNSRHIRLIRFNFAAGNSLVLFITGIELFSCMLLFVFSNAELIINAN